MMLKNTLYLDVFDEYIHLLGDILVQFLLRRLYFIGITSCEEQCVDSNMAVLLRQAKELIWQ